MGRDAPYRGGDGGANPCWVLSRLAREEGRWGKLQFVGIGRAWKGFRAASDLDESAGPGRAHDPDGLTSLGNRD